METLLNLKEEGHIARFNGLYNPGSAFYQITLFIFKHMLVRVLAFFPQGHEPCSGLEEMKTIP